ncbi:MAG: helix-turn-helix domain-containing protein [Actinomycetota bacterium]
MHDPTNDPTPPPTTRTYSVQEVAELLGISRTTAYECVRSGEIPCLRFRRRIVVPHDVIQELLECR